MTTPAKKRVRNRSKAANAATTETAGVGNKTHPGNLRVPEDVLIKRQNQNPEGTKISDTGPEVQGNKAMMVIDVRTSKPVKVFLVQGIGLLPSDEGLLVCVESSPIMDVMSAAVARAKFAVKKDGTVIYGQQGFDDAAHLDFDLLDIVKLIKSNHSDEGVAADEKLNAEADKANKAELADNAKAVEDKAATDKAVKDAEK